MGSTFDIQISDTESTMVEVTFYNNKIPLVYNVANTEISIVQDLSCKYYY